MTNLTTDTSRLTDPQAREVQLDITGMTCASCAMRIEKRLNKLDGVTATVNYATEKAKVTVTSDVDTDDLIAAVEAVGYSAAVPSTSPRSGVTDDEPVESDSTAPLRQRLLIVDRPGGTRDRAGDDPVAAVRRLAVAVAHPCRPGRHLGSMAVPPRRLGQPAPRHRHHGHADLDRHHRRVRLVACTPCSSATPA